MSEPKPDAICVHCGKRYADHVGWYTPTGTVMLCHKSWTIFDPKPQPQPKRKGK